MDKTTNFFPSPGPIGRVGRLLVGLGLWALFAWFLLRRSVFLQPGNLVAPLWGLVALFSHTPGYLLPAFRRARNRWLVLGGFAGLLMLLEAERFGSPFGPWFTLYTWLLALLYFALNGLEHIVAGVVGHPGCEATVFQRWTSSSPSILSCVLWTPIDRLEYRLRNRVLSSQKEEAP